MPTATADGRVVFGKNSDREPNEAQVLEYHPPQRYPSPSALGRTHGVIISRPFWMWGAEMGVNDQGLAIGNEAVFTRMPMRRGGGLTGMDLVRLTLERAASAEQAVDTLAGLLADHGQGGLCSRAAGCRTYHSSFLLADPSGAWVFETAGDLWAAKKINRFYAISNGLTIGSDCDRRHPDLVDTARRKGWLKKGRPFHFADCFGSPLMTAMAAARLRQQRMTTMISRRLGSLKVLDAMAMLRDHGSDDNAYRPDGYLRSRCICAHAGLPLLRHAAQTTGSFIAALGKDRISSWATATSAPCISIFKPLCFSPVERPPTTSPVIDRFSPDVYWWQHERFHRRLLPDLSLPDTYIARRDALEKSFCATADSPSDAAALSREAFRQSRLALAEGWQAISDHRPPERGRPWYGAYWRRQNRKARLPVE